MKQRGRISPFHWASCACPRCEQPARYPRLKRTLYTEKRRDLDLRPNLVEWSQQVRETVEPRHFYFWMCPHCDFVADTGFFDRPLHDVNLSVARFRRLLARELPLRSGSDKVLQRLLDFSQMEGAWNVTHTIRLNLAAIYYMETVPQIRDYESHILGSYYLRLAWFVRDLKKMQEATSDFRQEIASLLRDLQPFWSELSLIESTLLETSFSYYDNSLTRSSKVRSSLDEIQVQTVMARIKLQLGQLERAEQLIMLSKRKLFRFQQLLKQRESDPQLEMSNTIENQKRLTRCKRQVERVDALCDHVKQLKKKRERQRCLDLAYRLDDQQKTALEKREFLLSQGFPAELVQELIPLDQPKTAFIKMLKQAR